MEGRRRRKRDGGEEEAAVDMINVSLLPHTLFLHWSGGRTHTHTKHTHTPHTHTHQTHTHTHKTQTHTQLHMDNGRATVSITNIYRQRA